MKKIFVIATVSVATTIAMAQTPQATTAAAPAQTTTATAPAAATAATKPWSVSFKSLIDVDAGETRTAEAAIETENTVGFKYKLTDKDTISAEHVFYMVKSGINTDNDTRVSYGSRPIQGGLNKIGYRRSMDTTILGAKLAPGIKLVNAASGVAADGLTNTNFRNYTEADNNLSWTLTPLISMDLYVQHRAYLRSQEDKSNGRAAVSNRFVEAVTVSVNPNDQFSVYQAAGLIHGFEDGWAFRETRQRLYLETGLSYSPSAIKGLALGMNVNADMTYSSRLSSVERHKDGWYEDGASNDVLYEASASYTF